MHYVISYELCSLVFLCVISIHFFTRHQFPSLQNKFFAFFIISSFIDIILDVSTAILINDKPPLPEWFLLLINSLFFLWRIILSAALFLYIRSITGTLKMKSRLYSAGLVLPLALTIVAIVFNVKYGVFFYFNENLEYHHGPLYLALFVIAGFYLLLSMISIFKYRSKLPEGQLLTISVFILIIVAFSSVQVLLPAYLIIGVSVSLAICMLYLTLQNPRELQDDMTKLYNCSCFLRHFSETIKLNRSCSIVVISLDNFNSSGNAFGTDTANELIVEIARFLKSAPRRVNAFRLAATDFVLMCSGGSACLDAVRVISERFKRSWRAGGVDIELSACICYALDTDFSEIGGDILALLDHITSSARLSSHSAPFRFGQDETKELQRSRAIESALRAAIQEESLEVYFQPVCSEDGTVRSAEALVRFYHETMGFIPPLEFIPLAEKNGMMISIGEQVLKKICAYVKDTGLDRRENFSTIEMNLSTTELMQEGMPRRMLEIMDKYGVASKFISFGVGESAVASESLVIMKNMRELCDCGARFVLDGFGTGTKSVDYFLRFPFSAVKFSRSMLVESQDNEKIAAVMKHLVTLVKELGLSAVAEGAETEAQMAFISRLKADYIQGFYFSQPLPGFEFFRFIEAGSKDKALLPS